MRLAEEAKPKLKGSEQAHWLGVLEEEHANLRVALDFCLEESEEGEKGLRLGAALQQFWWTRGHSSEGRERLTAVLSHSGGQAPTWARASALNGAGGLAHIQGDYALARSRQKESLTIMQELGDKRSIAYSFEAFAFLTINEERNERCATLWGAAAVLREALGSPLPPHERDRYERKVAAVRETLGEDGFATAWAESYAMTMEQAITYALDGENR